MSAARAAVFGDASNPASTFSGTAGTTYTLRWTVTDGPCASTDDVVVTFNSNPTPAISGSSVVCSGDDATLDAGAGYAAYAWSGGGGTGQTATYINPTTSDLTVR
ncbi:MAG: hypothetical protein IPK76_14470 [Lewinellaceae bacterium]|nr:hypothetical protein [Lewinellaceae bacterium]